MTRASRLSRRMATITLSTLLVLVGTGSAFPELVRAAIPSPANCTVPALLVGRPSGANDTGVEIVVRDLNNSPIPFITVDLDFSGSGLRLYGAQNPGVTLDCSQGTLRVVTDAAGRARISPRFGGCTSGTGSVRIRAEPGVTLAEVPARSTDIDAVEGRAGLADFAAFATAYLEWAGFRIPLPDCLDFTGEACPLCDLAVFGRDFLEPGAGGYCP